MSEYPLGDGPIEPQYIEQMNVLAGFLDEHFNGEAKGQDRAVGFVLLVFPFGEREGRCNYISNGANRKDIVTMMREQIKRFEGAPEQPNPKETTNPMDGIDWLNRLAKWRIVFAGWQLGTRPKGDPEGDAVRDHREGSLLLRAEMNALCGLLIEKGIMTARELSIAMQVEAKLACADLEKRFPGITAVDDGLEMDPRKMEEAGTTKGWKP